MKNHFFKISLAAFLLQTSAFADSKVESQFNDKQNGGYEKTIKSENTSTIGTKKETESKVDVDVKNDGRVSKKEETSTVIDPEGLMNEKSKNTQTSYEEKQNGGYKQVTETRIKDAQGTNITLITTTDVDIDAQGNVVTTAKSEKKVDPKGLMNSTTSTHERKTVNGQLIEEKKEVK